jgi:prepilin-type processing-associated H-X9-DG protein
MKVAPHTSAGAAMYANSSFTVGLPGNSIISVGAVGGNTGYADGHVDWRTLPMMQINAASSIPGDGLGAW